MTTSRCTIVGENRVCGRCEQTGPRIGLFCGRCNGVIAAVPRVWAVTIVVLSPALVCLATSFYRSSWALLVALDLLVLAYLWFALRDIGGFWYVYPFVISAVAVAVYRSPLPIRDDVRAIALAVLFIWLIFALIASVRPWYISLEAQHRTPRWEITIAVVLLSLTAYYGLFEAAVGLNLIDRSAVFFGLLAPKDLLYPFFKLIWDMEHVYWLLRELVMIAIAVCILIAAMYQSLSNIVSAKEETNIIWKVAAIAYRFGEEVWYQTKRIIGGVISIQISFLVQHLVPWTVGVGFAVTLAYVSTVLFVYLQNSGSGLAVAWALLLGMVSLYLSIYVCHVGRLWRPGYGRPPYIRQLKTISRVSVVDSLMLLLHASYPIPIAVLLMIVLQRAFRLDLLPTRIGPFTITLLAILIVFIALGGGRRALNSKSAGVGRK